MEDFYIDQLIKKIGKSYYLDVLILIEAIIASYLLLIRWKHKNTHIGFTIFSLTLVYLFTYGSDINLSILFKNNYSLKKSILESGNIAFSLIEMLAFYFLFKQSIKNIKKLKYITYLFVIFLLYFFFQLIPLLLEQPNYKSVVNVATKIITIELLIIFIFCLLYYIDLIDKIRIKIPINIYELSLTNAIFFYTSVSLPFISIIVEIKATHKTLYKSLLLLHYSSVVFLLATLIYVLKKQKSSIL